jgi:hypothetical protein
LLVTVEQESGHRRPVLDRLHARVALGHIRDDVYPTYGMPICAAC